MPINDRIDQSVRESALTTTATDRIDQSVRETILSYSPHARISGSFRECIIKLGNIASQLSAWDNDADNQKAHASYYFGIQQDINDGSIPQIRKNKFPVTFVVS